MIASGDVLAALQTWFRDAGLDARVVGIEYDRVFTPIHPLGASHALDCTDRYDIRINIEAVPCPEGPSLDSIRQTQVALKQLEAELSSRSNTD